MLNQRVDWSRGAREFSRQHVVCVPEETPVDLASERRKRESGWAPHVYTRPELKCRLIGSAW